MAMAGYKGTKKKKKNLLMASAVADASRGQYIGRGIASCKEFQQEAGWGLIGHRKDEADSQTKTTNTPIHTAFFDHGER